MSEQAAGTEPAKDDDKLKHEWINKGSSGEITIGIDKIEDADEQNKLLLKQNEQIKEMAARLEKMEATALKKDYEKQRSALMEELKTLDPRLHDKHKDESDTAKIELLIETAKDFKTDFPKYKKEEEDENAPKPKQGYFDWNKGEYV